MGELLKQAINQGDSFWNDMEPDSDDESFTEEVVKPDEFDDDFNDTEDEESSSSDEEDQRKRAHKKTDSSKSRNKYAEPVVHKKTTKVIKKEKKSDDTQTQNASLENETGGSVHEHYEPASDIPRFVRESTKLKTQGADARLAQSVAASAKYRQRMVPQVKQQFTQRELLEDALKTEVVNAKWLQSQKLAEDERAALTKPVRTQSGVMKRTLSRRGAYTTITFTEDEAWPVVFLEQPPPKVPVKTCVVTGLPARYRDPLTGLPYANAEAFKVIRRQHQQSSIRGGGRSSGHR